MLYIIEENIDRMGGVERIVSLLANHFSKKMEVKVISVFKGDNTFFKYNNKVKKIYLSDVCFNNKNYSNKYKYLLLNKKVRNLCNEITDNDIVIFGRVPVAIKFLPFIKNNPNIIVRDAINLYDYSIIIKFFMKKYFPKKVNYFVISSKESLNIYQSFFDKKINYKIIFNPIGIKVSNLNYCFDNKIIMSNGRFDFQKGFNVLIAACKIVFKTHPDWKLLLIGDGSLKEQMKEYIDNNGLKNNVFLKDFSKNIEQELQNASIYVMTSRYEGYANSLVEAVCMGIPSITFNCLTGVNEIVKHNDNGLIVNLKDKYDYFKGIDNNENTINLANAICYLIDNKNVCKRMSNKAKNTLSSRKNELIFKEWEKMIYEKIDKNN